MNTGLSFKLFDSLPLFYTISTKQDGSMYEIGEVSRAKIMEYMHQKSPDMKNLTIMGQAHSPTVKFVTNDEDQTIFQTDGLVTDRKQLALGVVTADCLPILMYDPSGERVGVMHAGYKGLLVGIIESFLTTAMMLGAKKESMLLGIGPSIGKCCYNVEKGRIDAFAHTFPFLKDFHEVRDGVHFLDLASIAKQILVHSGISEAHIEVLSICTETDQRFFSYRRDSEEEFGEFVSLIGML